MCVCVCVSVFHTDEVLLGVTPSQRPDSPEFTRAEGAKTPPNLYSLHEEQSWHNEEEGYIYDIVQSILGYLDRERKGKREREGERERERE